MRGKKYTVLFIKQCSGYFFRACRASILYSLIVFPLCSYSQDNLLIKKKIQVPEGNKAVNSKPSYKNLQINNLPLNISPTVNGTVTDAHCYGSSDGSIDFIINGSISPYSYNWSNGVTGKIYGSYWNIAEIDNPGSTLTNYQIRIDINYAAGMKEDFSDIRFSDTSNTILYDYWMEDYIYSANAVFWVKVPNIPSGLSALKISYGDPDAVSLSNGQTTFDFFDDFNDNDISDWSYDCINISEPDELCSMVVEYDNLKLASYSHCGGPSTDGTGMNAKKNIVIPSGKYKIDVSSSFYICLHDACNDSARIISSTFYNSNPISAQWYIEQKGLCKCIYSAWFPQRSDPFISNGLPSEFMLKGQITDCGNGDILYDDFRIRKFSDQNPLITIGPPKTLTLSGLAKGDYTIQVTDGNGEVATKTFTVNQPVLPDAVNGSRCAGGKVNLSVSGTYSNYKWYNTSLGGTLLSNSITYQTDSLNSNTNYYVSAIGDNGCETDPRIVVTATINSLPLIPYASDNSRCGTGSVTLQAIGAPVSYNWYTSPNGGSPIETSSTYNTPNLTSTTTYYVSSVDINNCESQRTIVNAIVDPLSQGILAGADTILPGGTPNPIRIISRNGSVYDWEKSNNNLFDYTEIISIHDTFYVESILQKSKFYKASIKSGSCPNGYTNTIEIRVNQPHICYSDSAYAYSDTPYTSSVSVLFNDIDSIGDQLEVYPLANYTTTKGGIISMDINGNYNYNPPSKFIGTDSIHYIACDLYESPVRQCRSAALYLIIEDNRLRNENIIVYPTLSPNNDNLNDTWVIDGIEKHPQNKISIFDRWGNLVFETAGYKNTEDKIWKGNSNKGLIEGNNELPDGTYFYLIELGNNIKPKTGFVVIKR